MSKNKSLHKEKYKSGTISFNDKGFTFSIQKSPELFSNSDELRKIKNRKKGKK